MIVAIHQPNFLPWSGYFDKMIRADLFVILDTVQFVRREYDNRTRIKSATGLQWLTVPVEKANRQIKLLKVRMFPDVNWHQKHLKTLEVNYSRSRYFSPIISKISDIYEKDHKLLVDLNIDLIQFIRSHLGITTTVVRASELPATDLSGSDLIMHLCKETGADKYFSGSGGKNYLDADSFIDNGIALEYQEYEHPVYRQLHGDFLSGLSVVDILFNCGEDSKGIITKQRNHG